MRVLLVQHDVSNIASFPIGLGYVASALIKEGHHLQFCNLALVTDPKTALDQTIREFMPHVLGFTLWTLNYGEFVKLLSQCDSARGLTLVAGGPHASAECERVLRDGLVDIVVKQEGEVVAPHLFHTLEHQGDLSQVRGIAFLDDKGEYIQTENAGYAEDLDKLPPLPYELLHVHSYDSRIHGLPAATIMTSRGCPHKCLFCYRGPAAGRKYRYRSVKNVYDEICTLYKKYGFRAFHFYDDIFTLKRDRIIDLCNTIIASGLKVYWICQTRVDCVDFELLMHMKKAGCVEIGFGVESGNQTIVNNLQKNIDKKQVRDAFANCQKLNIFTVAFFILGTPWDTPWTTRETIDFAKQLKSTISVFFCATPYPGTRLREVFIEKGMYVPKDFSDYKHYNERGSKVSSSTEIASVQRTCLVASREIIMSQLLKVMLYPRLLKEHFNRYGIAGFIKRTVNTLIHM